MTARTVSARDLETMAHAAHEHVELPGPEGGWATATINGRAYRALVAPVDGRERCPDCRHLTEVHTPHPVIHLGRNLGCCAACERDRRSPCHQVRSKEAQ